MPGESNRQAPHTACPESPSTYMHKTSTDSNGKQTWVRRLAVGRLCLEVIPSAHALCRHMLQRIHLQFTDMRF